MVKYDFHTLFLRSASLVWLLCAGVAVAHGGEAFPRGDSTAAVARDARRQPALSQNPAQAFIRLGEMVAERDVALFSTDLLSTYKVLKGDKRNLTWLCLNAATVTGAQRLMRWLCKLPPPNCHYGRW